MFSGLFRSGRSTAIAPDKSKNTSGVYVADFVDPEELVFAEEGSSNGSGGLQQIVYRSSVPVTPDALDALCDKVGWPARQPGKLETALANSFLVSSVVLRRCGADGAPAEERLIGLARCTSDHVFNATIWDVLVDPEFQGRGIGKALVAEMVKALLRRDICSITLFADSNVEEFYEALGFEANPSGVRGMFWYP
ncbi:hypothetical protein WJX81_002058 [Elliptochloris bilobata]|uniref:N-acetyltransferase domain-containing protein n=1 Tax=Elliptochloris bilobata TaxID=381761 RepID=A0AAW1RN18_9CHLO